MRFLKFWKQALVAALVLLVATSISPLRSSVVDTADAKSKYQMTYTGEGSVVHPRASDGEPCREHTFQKGDSDGPHDLCVTALQREFSIYLAMSGYGGKGTAADGDFGGDTERVVLLVQSLLETDQDGVVTPSLWKAVQKRLDVQVVPAGTYVDPNPKNSGAGKHQSSSDPVLKSTAAGGDKEAGLSSSGDEPETACNSGKWWVSCTLEQQGLK